MASAEFNLFTIEKMGTPPTITVTDEATGFPKAYLINNDLDRSFKFLNASGTKTIDYDFGSGFATLLDYAFLWLRNYTSITGSSSCSIYSSTNGSAWTFRGSLTIVGLTRESSLSTYLGVTARYWRFQFASLSAAPEIGMAAMCVQRKVIHPGDLPQSDIPIYHNRLVTTESGRTLVTAINSRKRRVFDRRYTLPTKADRDTIVTAWQESGGVLRPVIFQENASVGGNDECIVCRFDENGLSESQTAFEFYEMSMRLIEVPSIPAGATF